MRRTLAAAILGIGLWIGSMAWSGFLITQTVLNPDKSRDIADALYEDETVRDQLVANIADAVERALPPGAPVPRQTVEEAARTALESPAVEEVFIGALVQSHRAFLGEADPPDAIDAGAFTDEARSALVAVRPELDGVLPPAPTFVIELPTDRIPNLGGLRRTLDAVVPLGALASAAAIATALLVTSNRPAILRRAGFWALGLSAVVLFLAYGIPWLAQRFAPDQSEIVAALIGALVAQTRGPALAAAAAGAGAIGASFVWKATPVVLGALDGDGVDAADVGRRDRIPAGPRGYSSDAAGTFGATGARRGAPQLRRPAPGPTLPKAAAGDGYGEHRAVPRPDPHPGYPSQRPAAPGSHDNVVPMPGADRVRPRTRWVDGVGHVLESSEDVPADARWVPGVGYVVDEP